MNPPSLLPGIAPFCVVQNAERRKISAVDVVGIAFAMNKYFEEIEGYVA
jgi:hypothetical protein